MACKSGNQEIFHLLLQDKRILFDEKVFFECDTLKNIQIPSFITEIGDYAFSGCSSLSEVQIPNSVTKIGDFAFNKCSSLIQISIPSSVKEIGIYILEGCTSLKTVFLPISLNCIEKLGISKNTLIKII